MTKGSAPNTRADFGSKVVTKIYIGHIPYTTSHMKPGSKTTHQHSQWGLLGAARIAWATSPKDPFPSGEATSVANIRIQPAASQLVGRG